MRLDVCAQNNIRSNGEASVREPHTRHRQSCADKIRQCDKNARAGYACVRVAVATIYYVQSVTFVVLRFEFIGAGFGVLGNWNCVAFLQIS